MNGKFQQKLRHARWRWKGISEEEIEQLENLRDLGQRVKALQVKVSQITEKVVVEHMKEEDEERMELSTLTFMKTQGPVTELAVQEHLQRMGLVSEKERCCRKAKQVLFKLLKEGKVQQTQNKQFWHRTPQSLR